MYRGSLKDVKQKFDEKVSLHNEVMRSNPFSGNFKNRNPTYSKDRPEYGKPVAGSKSEKRALDAAARINGEVKELCNIIYDEGEKYTDDTAAMAFGELFQLYTRISSKVVGILLRARKHGFLHFEGEVLFQGRDNNVPIFLTKPIGEIRHELSQDTQFEVGVCHRAISNNT